MCVSVEGREGHVEWDLDALAIISWPLKKEEQKHSLAYQKGA